MAGVTLFFFYYRCQYFSSVLRKERTEARSGRKEGRMKVEVRVDERDDKENVEVEQRRK